jgi:cytochrome c
VRSILLPVVALWALSSITSVAFAQGDATSGKKYFQSACSACHSVNPGQNGVGPTLRGVVGRKSGSVPEFAYTPALKAADLAWDEKSLDEFLANPAQKVAGTSKIPSFSSGI